MADPVATINYGPGQFNDEWDPDAVYHFDIYQRQTHSVTYEGGYYFLVGVPNGESPDKDTAAWREVATNEGTATSKNSFVRQGTVGGTGLVIAKGDALTFDVTGELILADNRAPETAKIAGLALSSANTGDTLKFAYGEGALFTNSSFTLIPGANYYLDIDGAFIPIEPVASGVTVASVGWAVDATTLQISFSNLYSVDGEVITNSYVATTLNADNPVGQDVRPLRSYEVIGVDNIYE